MIIFSNDEYFDVKRNCSSRQRVGSLKCHYPEHPWDFFPWPHVHNSQLSGPADGKGSMVNPRLSFVLACLFVHKVLHVTCM
jgi:hypothetical protein